MAVYTVDLDGNTSISASAGSLTLNLTFHWAEAVQGQLDKWLSYIDLLMRSDPLVDKETGITLRQYDWLSYYGSLRNVTISTWYQEAQYVPQSVWKLPVPEIAMREKVQSALKIVDIVDGFQERCIWTATVADNITDEPTVISVRTGGWQYGPNQDWALRFLSYKEQIGVNDLGSLTLEVEVKE